MTWIVYVRWIVYEMTWEVEERTHSLPRGALNEILSQAFNLTSEEVWASAQILGEESRKLGI